MVWQPSYAKQAFKIHIPPLLVTVRVAVIIMYFQFSKFHEKN